MQCAKINYCIISLISNYILVKKNSKFDVHLVEECIEPQYPIIFTSKDEALELTLVVFVTKVAKEDWILDSSTSHYYVIHLNNLSCMTSVDDISSIISIGGQLHTITTKEDI